MHILIPNPRFISNSTYKSPFQPNPHVNPKLTSTHSHITSHYTIQNQKPYSATCFFIIYTHVYIRIIYIFLKALHQLHNSTAPSLITSSFFFILIYLFIFIILLIKKTSAPRNHSSLWWSPIFRQLRDCTHFINLFHT